MSSVVGTTPLMFGCKRGLSQHLDFFFNVRTEFIIFTRILMVWQKKLSFLSWWQQDFVTTDCDFSTNPKRKYDSASTVMIKS